jgi:GNAT superfamily N-acetyltransferase
MRLRPATAADLPALAAVQRSYDITWFGAPEHNEDEVCEWLELADAVSVAESGDRAVAFGNKSRTGSALVLDPTADVAAATGLLVPWLAQVGAPDTEVLDRDDALRSALVAAGWRHQYSSFELLRRVTDQWTRAAPVWPDGVVTRPFEPGQDAQVHHLVYAEAGWADVAGHHMRDLAEWQQIFLAGRPPAERPLVAWRHGRPVGVALLRVFSDRTGWVAQLAVARGERGRGLGRALLLAAFERLVAAGATKVGLSVIATNRAALRLYLDVGLRNDREWQTFTAGP